MEGSHETNEKATSGKWTSIVNILVAFIKKTKELQIHLEKEFPEEEREDYIGTIERLLEERQGILTDLPDLSTVLDERNKVEMISLETKIQELMKKHQEKIKTDIKTLQLQKKKGQNYSDPYSNVSADGMFLDKKK